MSENVMWVDIIPSSTAITTVYVGHSEDLDTRSIGLRMGEAARAAARTLAHRIESATGRTVRVRAQRYGERGRTEFMRIPVTVQRYRMMPVDGELKDSYTLYWEDRPCSTAHSSREAESQVRRWGKPTKVVRKLAYWWGDHSNNTRDFRVLRTDDLTTSFT